jgi:signal transduction histidine kinase/DNA-binding response OmpR family regulator
MKYKILVAIVIFPLLLMSNSPLNDLHDALREAPLNMKAKRLHDLSIYHFDKNLDSAEYYADLAHQQALLHKQSKIMVNSTLMLAKISNKQKEYKQAILILDASLKSYKNFPDVKIEALEIIASNYEKLNDLKSMERYAQMLLLEIEKKAKESNDLQPIINTLMLLSDAAENDERLTQTYFDIAEDIETDGSMDFEDYMAIKLKYYSKLEQERQAERERKAAMDKIYRDAETKEIYEQRGDSLAKALSAVKATLYKLKLSQESEAAAKIQDSLTKLKNDSLQDLQIKTEWEKMLEQQKNDSIQIANTEAEQLRQQNRDRMINLSILIGIIVVCIIIFTMLRQKYLAKNAIILEEKNKQLEIAEKEAVAASVAKSEFLANTSHEIRTPLNAILGFSELLKSNVTDPKNMGYVNSIMVSGKNLLNIINDILDLSKIEAGKMDLVIEPVDLSQMMDEIALIFEFKAKEKGIQFSVDTKQAEKVHFEVDEVRLRQVLINLAGNAMKFTEEGSVKLHYCTKNINQENQTGDLHISVSDTGIGIPQEQQDAIFEAFKQRSGQSTKKYGGTGLGLAISQRLVKMMQGELILESQLGVGSTFTIKLEDIQFKTEVEANTNKKSTINPDTVIFDKNTILIVDDIDQNRELMKEFLAPTNLEVIEADSGEVSVELAQEKTPKLILMDLRMPGISGYDALKQIRAIETTKHIPIIAQTASVMKKEKDTIFDFGFDSFLEKPAAKHRVFEEIMKFIPHTIQEAQEKVTTDETSEKDYSLSKKCKANLEVVFEKMEEEYKPRLAEFEKAVRVMQMKEIVKEMRDFADEYEIAILKEYVDGLEEAINSFNRQKIKTKLQEFDSVINTIKEQC